VTKAELIKMLEPFDDDIKVVFHGVGYGAADTDPKLHYTTDTVDGEAHILLADSDLSWRTRTVRLQ
jgi:hypothetical protein